MGVLITFKQTTLSAFRIDGIPSIILSSGRVSVVALNDIVPVTPIHTKDNVATLTDVICGPIRLI